MIKKLKIEAWLQFDFCILKHSRLSNLQNVDRQKCRDQKRPWKSNHSNDVRMAVKLIVHLRINNNDIFVSRICSKEGRYTPANKTGNAQFTRYRFLVLKGPGSNLTWFKVFNQSRIKQLFGPGVHGSKPSDLVVGLGSVQTGTRKNRNLGPDQDQQFF